MERVLLGLTLILNRTRLPFYAGADCGDFSSSKKIAMGEGTCERTSVEEQMTKRDADLALAMESLEAVAQDVAVSIGKFAESTCPGEKVLSVPAAPRRNRGFPKEFGLAGDIGCVVYRLKLLQAAIDKATRRQQRSNAARYQSPGS